MPKWITKVIVTITILGFLGLSFGPAFVPQAQARLEVPVGDIFQRAFEKGTLLNRIGDLAQTFLEWADIILTNKLKQILIKLLQDTALESVLGGGLPEFVTSYLSLFDEIEFQVLEEFADTLDSISFCSTFSQELKRAFGGGGPQLGADTGVFGNTVTCTLQDTIKAGTPIEDFYAGDFLSGGYDALLASWGPENNLFGAFTQTFFEQQKKLEEEFLAGKQEVSDAQGFRSQTRCDGPDCLITKPGIVVKDLLTKTLGADVDFIVNAETFFEIAMNALDTVLSKAISGGLDEIGLDSAAIRTERDRLATASQEVNDQNFASTKQDLITRLGGVIANRQSADTTINQDITNTENYIASLQGIQNQISNKLAQNNPVQCLPKPAAPRCFKAFNPGFSCFQGFGNTGVVNIAQLKTNLQNEITRAQGLVQDLRNKENDNDQAITLLENQKDEIEAFENTDEGRSGLQEKQQELRTVTPEIALEFKIQSEDNRDDNRETITNNLTRPAAAGDPGGFNTIKGTFDQCNKFR